MSQKNRLCKKIAVVDVTANYIGAKIMSVLIDDLEHMKVMPISDGDRRYNQGITNCIEKLKSMTLTDEEQRIFLAAMGKEEKICKEIDENNVLKPYLKNLMQFCDGVRRKVKGALWTTLIIIS